MSASKAEPGTEELLDEQRILDEARRRFAVDEPLEAAFRPALRALLRALHQEARLSPEARPRVAEGLLRSLGERVALAELEAREPEVCSIAVERPIVITGFPRTGTSFLHNLLARVDGLWSPALWQLRTPVAPAEGGAELEQWRERQREDTAALVRELYTAAPSFEAIRPMKPDWPEECNWILRNCFSTLVNAFTWFVPSYVEYLGGCDMGAAYADHRRFFRALVHRRGLEAGAHPRLVLKDPFHMWHVEDLLEVYPDATIVHLHRMPAEVVPSLASLCWTWQSIDSDAPRTRAEVGRFCLYLLDRGLRALERARTRVPAERFVDISYRELVAAPGSVLRRLGEGLGFAAEGEAVEQAGEWLDRNRGSKASRHRYTLDDFGLDEEVLDEYFAAYRARFGRLL